jgi:hypothetical protein
MLTTAKRPSLFLAVAALALTLGLGARPAPAFDGATEAIEYVPDNVSMVLGIETKTLFESEQFRDFFERNGGDDARSFLRLVKAMAGVHLTEDIHEIILFMNLEDNGCGAVIQGKLDQSVMLELLRESDPYSAPPALAPQQPQTLAQRWATPEEPQMRYGVFASGDAMVLTTSQEMLDACLEAKSDPATSFAQGRGSGLIPSRSKKVAVWGALTAAPRELQEMLRVTAISGAMSLQGDAIVLGGTIKIENDQDVEQWISMIRGFLSLAQIQQEYPELAQIASSIRLDKTRGGGNSVEVEVVLNFADLPSLSQALGLN